jgi:hypothetical protein
MIPQTIWDAMNPQQQADAWWFELDQMITLAMSDLVYTADNEDTIVHSGLTTIVATRIAVTP